MCGCKIIDETYSRKNKTILIINTKWEDHQEARQGEKKERNEEEEEEEKKREKCKKPQK